MSTIEQYNRINRKRVEKLYVLYPFFVDKQLYTWTQMLFLVMSYKARFQLAVMSLLRKRYDIIALLL